MRFILGFCLGALALQFLYWNGFLVVVPHWGMVQAQEIHWRGWR